VRNFFVGVYCLPSSICSQNVYLSNFPCSFSQSSNGVPLIQWKRTNVICTEWDEKEEEGIHSEDVSNHIVRGAAMRYREVVWNVEGTRKIAYNSMTNIHHRPGTFTRYVKCCKHQTNAVHNGSVDGPCSLPMEPLGVGI
jgi:hypothetical protein